MLDIRDRHSSILTIRSIRLVKSAVNVAANLFFHKTVTHRKQTQTWTGATFASDTTSSFSKHAWFKLQDSVQFWASAFKNLLESYCLALNEFFCLALQSNSAIFTDSTLLHLAGCARTELQIIPASTILWGLSWSLSRCMFLMGANLLKPNSSIHLRLQHEFQPPLWSVLQSCQCTKAILEHRRFVERCSRKMCAGQPQWHCHLHQGKRDKRMMCLNIVLELLLERIQQHRLHLLHKYWPGWVCETQFWLHRGKN